MKRLIAVMKLFVTGLMLTILTGGFISTAWATDQDNFNKLIGKVAPTLVIGQKLIPPKVACVCNDSVPSGLPGFIVTLSGSVRCVIPEFGSDGSVDGGSICNSYVVL